MGVHGDIILNSKCQKRTRPKKTRRKPNLAINASSVWSCAWCDSCSGNLSGSVWCQAWFTTRERRSSVPTVRTHWTSKACGSQTKCKYGPRECLTNAGAYNSQIRRSMRSPLWPPTLTRQPWFTTWSSCFLRCALQSSRNRTSRLGCYPGTCA